MFGFYHGRHAMRHGGGGARHHRGFGHFGRFGGAFADDEGEERGQGGRRRRFDGEEFRLLLLALLDAGPRHGYDLIREVEERTGGAYVPSPGVVYPALAMLDEMGLVEAVASEGARKRFALTAGGRAHLAERRDAADALLARLARLAGRGGADGRGAVRDALAGLHHALRGALAAAPERQAEVVAILGEAARRIGGGGR